MRASKLKAIFGAVLVLSSVSSAFADSEPADPGHHNYYGVPNWRDLVPEKAAEYKTYRAIVLSNPTYTDDEKAAKIAKKYSQIQEQVKTARTETYTNFSELAGVGNSATKGGSGGSPVRVDAKCTGASKEQMYTRPDWARGAYKSGNAQANAAIFNEGGILVPGQSIVAPDGSVVCAIALKQSGAGRKYAYSEATFHIRPERVKVMVDAEVPAIMYAISSTPI